MIMSKKEAEKKALEKNKEMAKKFCPLARQNCRPDCVCYYSAWEDASSVGGVGWEVRGGNCTAYAFVGE